MVRADDRLKQAKKDILHSKESLKIEHFEWTVLAAQQGAEKAIKAVDFELGGDPWGHSLPLRNNFILNDIHNFLN